MQVELRYDPLVRAAARLRRLGRDVDAATVRCVRTSPISLPTLRGVPPRAEWLREEAPTLDALAAIALLLDTDGDGSATFTFHGSQWSADAALRQVVGDQFGSTWLSGLDLDPDELARLMLTLGSVGRDLPASAGGMTPEELKAFLLEHPEVAKRLSVTPPREGAPGAEGALAALYAARNDPGPYERMDRARELFESLSPQDAAILAMMFPRQAGNMNGVPFEYRADANQVHIIAELDDERDRLKQLEYQHEENQHDWDLFGLNNDDLEGPIKDSKALIALYESVLDNDRQIILFNPVGSHDGMIAELHGDIGERTRNVGVLVPGTGNKLLNFDSTAKRSNSFMSHNTDDSLAMISWIGGDLPDGAQAADPGRATTLAPLLEQFSYAVDQEIAHSAAAGNDVRTTYAGHSYGGAVVGSAEAHGLRADRVLHIESAGTGHGIDSPGDLPPSQKDVDRYSMTAPGDFIEMTQGNGLFGYGHGADPDDFDGVTRLHTGNTADGEILQGWSAHSDVFKRESDAWKNMYRVFTGGVVETYRSPEYTTYGSGWGTTRVQTGWKDDGKWVDIE